MTMNFQEIIDNQNNKIQALEAQINFYQSELNTYQKRCDQYAAAYDQMTAQLKELLRNRFGKKSERFIDPENPQTNFFNTDQTFQSADVNGNQIEESNLIKEHLSKKKNKNKKDIPVRIEIIPVADADKTCGCGALKSVIRYETKTLHHYQPAVFEVIEQRREVVACPNECEAAWA